MSADPALRALAERVAAFHITDRAMNGAQRAIESALARGQTGEGERRSYCDAVQRYFEGFDREARAHLRDVDRRLERINQIQFNLTAERGVAIQRIEATQGVLTALAGLRDHDS
jgi:DNA-binding transcriptional regulator GbsR (MarR family)